MLGRILAFATVVCLPTQASAELTKTFTVGAIIANGCSITASGGGGTWGDIVLAAVIGLGSQTSSGTLLANSASGIQLDCTPGMTAIVTADQGNQSSGGVRRLVNSDSAASLVPYQLYANNSATPWTTQAISLSFPVGTSHVSLPVRAVATLSGATRGGLYSDTVRVTVSW